jgi:Flp pilus assembly protein TadD
LIRRGLNFALASVCACWLLGGCVARPDHGPDHALIPSSRLNVAEAAEDAGDRQIAGSMYLAAADEASLDAAVQVRSAEGLARIGRLDDAQTLLERRLDSGMKDPNLLRTLGALQVMTGKPVQALQTLSAILSGNPKDIRALVDKAVALDILLRHEEAQGLYRQALALSPDDATISSDLALSLTLSGRVAEAERVLAPYRGNAGLPERIKINLGIVAAASGHPADAEALLGSRIGAADLATLTQAINRGAEGQP